MTVKIIVFINITKTNINFLKSYGWEVNLIYADCEKITIPDPFDRVYESYNRLMTEAGLDLSLYKGKRCIRYTYKIKNYPNDIKEDVWANVICCGNEAIGGDIMTVGLSGFMHSLNYPAKTSVTYCFMPVVWNSESG